MTQKYRHLGTITQLCRAMSSQLRHVSTIGKNLLHSNISPRCPHNTANFCLLMAEIGSRVWGTPANFNGFRILASFLHPRRSTEVNQTLHDVWPSPGLVHYTPWSVRQKKGTNLYVSVTSWKINRFQCSFIMAVLCSRCGHYIFVPWFLPSFFFFSLVYSQPSEIECLPYFRT